MSNMIDHPMWDESKIPPQTLRLINSKNSAQRRTYLAKLYESYMRKLADLDAIALRMSEAWLTNQARYLHAVADEVQALQDLECSGSVEWDGEHYATPN